MNWEIVEQTLEEKFSRAYVACHEPRERKTIVDAIVSNFPQHSRSLVEKAIDRACRIMDRTPRNRATFLHHVQEALQGKISRSIGFDMTKHQSV